MYFVLLFQDFCVVFKEEDSVEPQTCINLYLSCLSLYQVKKKPSHSIHFLDVHPQTGPGDFDYI